LAAVALLTHTYAAIVLGVLAAVAVQRLGEIHLTWPGRATLAAALALAAAGLVLDIGYELTAPVAGLCVVLLLAMPGRRHPAGAVFGGMSYPLYLNHWIGAFAFNFLMPGMRDSPIRHALSAIANVLLAIALYWFIDRRLLASRNGWFTAQRGRAVTLVAYAMVATGLAYGAWMLGR
jgi:peptidoglycan/LPS O-acetylase OafA/YrhL